MKKIRRLYIYYCWNKNKYAWSTEMLPYEEKLFRPARNNSYSHKGSHKHHRVECKSKKTKPFHSRGLQPTTITSKCVVSHSYIYHIQKNHQNPIVSVLEHFDWNFLISKFWSYLCDCNKAKFRHWTGLKVISINHNCTLYTFSK